MKSFIQWLGVGALIVVALIAKDVLSPAIQKAVPTFRGGYGLISEACDVNSSTVAQVGPTSGNGEAIVLSAHSLRAWARVQVAPTSTDVIFLSFNEGSSAAIDSGVAIASNYKSGSTNSSSTPNFIDFGRNTDFPYTGIVTAKTSGSATTSVLVTECRY